MSSPPEIDHLLIVGPGRLGLALGWELWRSGAVGSITYRGRRTSPPVHPVFVEAKAGYIHGDAHPPRAATVILLTVPDAVVESVADSLLPLDGSPVVLHTSGVLGSEVLTSLRSRRWPTGSIHPLVSIPDPVTSAPKLHGAFFGIEGVPEAVAAAGSMAQALGGHALRLVPEGKSAYHAAAVMASNYLVTLMAVAVETMTSAGVSRGDAVAALSGLGAGALNDVSTLGPEMALTGPILRGDGTTIALHLARLSPEVGPLYSVLGRRAVAIALGRGLEPAAAARILEILEAGDS